MLNDMEGRIVNNISKTIKDPNDSIVILSAIVFALVICATAFGVITFLGFVYGLQEVDAPYSDIVSKVSQVQTLEPSKDRTEFLNIVENAIENEYLSLNEQEVIESMHGDLMLSVKIGESRALLND